MANSRPQLNADDLGQLRWLAGGLLALLGSWTVFFMEIAAWGLVLAINLAVLAAFLRPAWPARVPHWVHRLAFPVIVVAFAYDLYASGEPLASLIRLDLTLILYRICSHRQRRDDLQLIVLCLFLIIVAGVLTVSLAFAVQIIVFAAVALGFLLAITLADATGTAEPPARTAPAWTRHASWRDLARRVRAAADWRLVFLGGALFAGVVVLSGLLFLAIPRFEFGNNFGVERWLNRTVHTGFSEFVQFGDVTDITQDNTLALVVDVPDPAAMPADPYWRMVVLDEYTETGFAMSQALRVSLNPPDNASRPNQFGTAPFTRGAPSWTFYFEAGVSRYLPLLGNFYQIAFTEPQSFATNDRLRVVALRNDPAKMLAYRVNSMETGGAMRDATFALARRSERPPEVTFLDLPSLTPPDLAQLQAWVNEIGRGTDAADFATRAANWLRSRHAYSLTSALPPGDSDPLVRWMSADGPGHCEYFAGSLVVLARAAGYPARLVTGFRGGSWNSYSGSFAVRNANAHAWTEIFDDASAAWLRADPTPGHSLLGGDAFDAAALAAAANRPPEIGWQARIESLRVFWYRRIVNFDENTQAELLEATKNVFKTTTAAVIRRIDDTLERTRTWLLRPWDGGRWLALGGTLLLVVAALLTWTRGGGRSRWLRWRSARSRHVAQDPVRRHAGRWLRRLDRVPTTGARFSPNVREELLNLRYGDRTTWPDPVATLRRAKQAWRDARRRPQKL